MMNFNLKSYATLVFDCDGVILDSNKIKTKAFYETTIVYGEAAAREMVNYHLANGGVSRYKKFAYFLENIAPKYSLRKDLLMEYLLKSYAEHVRIGLLNCDVAPGLKELRHHTHNSRWMIVSGGDQEELRDVFKKRGIADWFDGGIFGSPNTKDEILSRELLCRNITKPALFLGDSKYDFEAASNADMDFVFLNAWTEVIDWQDWIVDYDIYSLFNIESLLSDLSS